MLRVQRRRRAHLLLLQILLVAVVVRGMEERGVALGLVCVHPLGDRAERAADLAKRPRDARAKQRVTSREPRNRAVAVIAAAIAAVVATAAVVA